MYWDAFICHATEDKKELVQPLADELKSKGLNIWYDDFSLRVGDSLRRSIDRGLAQSRFGIVVLSPDFFKKKWPQYELDGLAARETNEKVILPIWHNVSRDEVATYSPTLADRIALMSDKGIPHIANKLMEVIRPDPMPPALSMEPSPQAGVHWNEPLAPLTLENMVSYAATKEPRIDWRTYARGSYGDLRAININNMAQLVEAVEDTQSRQTLTAIYQRLLGRDPDWVGIFAFQPFIFLFGPQGRELVEQSILRSPEYRGKMQKDQLQAGIS